MDWRIYLSESLVRWARDGAHPYHVINLHMLEMHDMHDDDLHPPGRISCCQKAVKKALISRLRRLGMEAMDKKM